MKIQNRGWIVTWGAFGINLAASISYCWSIYAAALVKSLGFTAAQTSIPYTLILVTMSLFSILGGKLQSIYGPRPCVIACAFLYGTGLVICGLSDSITAITIGFGLVAGAGAGIANGAVIPAVVRWFPSGKRGLISGIVLSGVGLSSLYIAPLTQYFVDNFGVSRAFIYEGIIFGGFILIMSVFLLKPSLEFTSSAVPDKPGQGVKAAGDEFKPAKMLATRQFWLIWFMYMFGATAGLMIISQLATIAKMQTNTKFAFVFVAILGIFNAGGRLIAGITSDKIGRKKTLTIVFVLQAFNMLFFSRYTTAALITVGIAAAGICYGSLLSVFPVLTYDYFGMENGGVNYGIVFSAYGVGAIVGPSMAAYIADATGTYHLAYMVAAVLLVLAVLMSFLLKPPAAKKESSKE